MLEGSAAPDKELLPVRRLKSKHDIVMEVQTLWKLLEVDTFDVWEWRRCYLVFTLFVENCLQVGTEENYQSLQCR